MTGTGDLQKIPAGDWARSNVNYNGGEFTGTVTNVTTGAVTGWSFLGYGADPNQGEAFAEHPQGYNLSDFGTVTFRASSVDGTELDDVPGVNIATDPYDTLVPSGISTNGAFAVTWVQC